MFEEKESPDVDVAMAEKMVQMAKLFETEAVEAASDLSGMGIMSIAISLKRIADTLGTVTHNQAQANTGLSSLCAILGSELKIVSGQLRSGQQALYSIENALRSNDGRNITLEVRTKD